MSNERKLLMAYARYLRGIRKTPPRDMGLPLMELVGAVACGDNCLPSELAESLAYDGTSVS